MLAPFTGALAWVVRGASPVLRTWRVATRVAVLILPCFARAATRVARGLFLLLCFVAVPFSSFSFCRILRVCERRQGLTKRPQFREISLHAPGSDQGDT